MPLYFVANEARKHVKVVLSGEGADELFGGYNIYREPIEPASASPRLPGGLRKGLAAVGRALPQGFRGKDLLRRGSLDLEERYYGNARIFREEQLAGLLRTYSPGSLVPRRHRPGVRADHRLDPIARMQHVDLFTWLRGDILVKADKMTMANSLELRVPFLDTRGVRGGQDHPGRSRRSPSRPPSWRCAGRWTTDRPAARAAPAQARLPGADPAFPGRRAPTTGRGTIITTAQTDEYLDPAAVLAIAGRRTGPARPTTPGGSGRSWCSRSGTASSSPGRSPRRSRSRSTRCGCSGSATGRGDLRTRRVAD